jgi:hypothetical protein
MPTSQLIVSAPSVVNISKLDTDTDTEFNHDPLTPNHPIRVAVCNFPAALVTDSDYLEIQVGGVRVVIILNTQKGK